jgi:NADH:ubiquinone oxidoreductase subunit 6 (subunit J)
LSLLSDILFYFFSASLLLFAFGVLLLRSLLHAAFSLMGSLLSVAGLFVWMGAPFLAISQVLVYVGGILILIIFGVFLTQRETQEGPFVGYRSLFLVLFFILLACVGWFYLLSHLSVQTSFQGVETRQIGMQLMTYAAVPLQIAGLLLLLVMVGATHIGQRFQRKDD